MPDLTPEDKARQKIDALLAQTGWVVQARKEINLSAARGVAIGELSFKSGEPDYTLFADGKAIGTVEAKPEGFPLIGVEEQSTKYVTGMPGGLPAWRKPLPFCYESTGSETRFTNRLDPDPRSRNVFTFHRPETLLAWVQREKQLAQRLREYPPLKHDGLWPAQFTAITNLEKSFACGRRRALIQMATGSGKTFTAVNFVYRILKQADINTRILFLVDRGNLGEQTLKEFQQFVSPLNNFKFTEEFIVQHLTSNTLDKSARVVIGTIQRLYSMLRGEAELDPELDEKSGYEIRETLWKQPLPVAYNPALPVETFDLIITDECHRSIYNLWRQVLEYFDASLIGLTATPNKQTFGFFEQNLVMEYNHEKAVADGVNVNYDVYRIRTDITERGSKVEAGLFVDKRDRLTRKKRWEQLDDDLTYDAAQLDRDVVAEDQIRTVLTAYRDRLFTEIFPGRTDVPKTLIFAKDDSHADDIVRIGREVFGKGNDFCQKITYRTTGAKPRDLIQQFRNSYFPRIAVTVDMIATGTDVKPLEVVFFMRSVKSLSFFEQMKGRGVRVITDTDFQAVTPDAKTKTRFVVVDAVGVCERDKSDSRPLERKPHVPFEKLLEAVALGNREPDTLSSLAGRLARLERALDEPQKQEVARLTGGKSLGHLSRSLIDALDPDKVEEASRLLAAQSLESGGGVSPLSPIHYFDPEAPIATISGDLPHWRQQGATYFVTFRLADSLPQEKLDLWRQERDKWMAEHPEPHDEATRRDYYERFPQRMQQWLDAGAGSCILARAEIKNLVEGALRHFQGERYRLDQFVVAPNHVHAIVTPTGEHTLSGVLHSWKSYTSHEIAKLLKSGSKSGRGVPALNQSRDGSATLPQSPAPESNKIWQKETFDHIVRNPASLERFRDYIRNHGGAGTGSFTVSYLEPTQKQRRDAAATMLNEAAAPLATNPDLRRKLVDLQRAAEQTIDTVSRDKVIFAGAALQSTQESSKLTRSFRHYLNAHRAEITALQLLYSRPYHQRLTESMLKELEKKLREEHAAWTEDNLWNAFAAVEPARVKGRSQAGRFADLVALVRFALKKQPVLEPFADSVTTRFNEWLMDKAKAHAQHSTLNAQPASPVFTPEQLSWLYLIRDHIATSLSIEPDDLQYTPFIERGGLGKASLLFGASLQPILNELSEALVA